MRNQEIDIAKGLAGILVVLGHALAFRYQAGWLLQLTHLTTPLFIFLAGVFFAPHKPWRVSLWRKADGLLKPYVVVLLVWGIVHAMGGKLDWLSYAAGIVYGTGPTIVLVPLWFIPHLFLCLVTGTLVIRFGERLACHALVRILLMVLLVSGGIATVDVVWRQPLPPGVWQRLFSPSTHWPGLPFSADVLLLTLPALLAGYWLSAQVRQFRPRLPAVLIALAVVVLLLADGHAVFDINRRNFEGGLLAVLFIIAGIYLVLSLSGWLSRMAWMAAPLAYIGRGFLLILLLHLLVLRSLFRALDAGLPDWSAWHVPLAFAGGMVLSVMLVEIVNRQRWLSLLLLPLPREKGVQ